MKNFLITVFICLLAITANAFEPVKHTCIGDKCFNIREAENVKAPRLLEEGKYTIDIFEKKCGSKEVGDMSCGFFFVRDGANGPEYMYENSENDLNPRVAQALGKIPLYLPEKYDKMLFTSGKKISTYEIKEKLNKMLSDMLAKTGVTAKVKELEIQFHGLTQFYSQPAQYHTYSAVMEVTLGARLSPIKTRVALNVRSITTNNASNSIQEYKTEVLVYSNNKLGLQTQTEAFCYLVETFTYKD